MESTDIVVIGSGIAGICTAVEAAAAGNNVLVLEAADEIGGASMMSGAGCCLVGTPLQESNGIRDDVDLALADWRRTGGPTADLAWARRYLEASRTEVYQWCERFGVRWVGLTRPEGNSVARWHLPEHWGRGIVKPLLAHAETLGVQFSTRSSATALLRRGRSVCGVRIGSGDGSYDVDARAVVVATGGFVANLDMVLDAAPHLRELPRLLSGGSPTATGMGHRLLAAVGAAFTCLDHVWVYPNGTPDPRDPTGVRGVGIRGVTGAVWLNAYGERFHDETNDGAGSGTRALLAQPGMTAWAVFTEAELPNLLLIDNEHFATPAGPHPEAMAGFWRESAHSWLVDDVAELATGVGLPLDAVRDNLDVVNRTLASGLPHEPCFGRPTIGLHRFAGRLAVIQIFPMAQKNFGGVRTDLECRVLDRSSEPIPGLLAAGEVAGMAGGHVNGVAALEGTMFGPCMYSGRIAGITATADVDRRGVLS